MKRLALIRFGEPLYGGTLWVKWWPESIFCWQAGSNDGSLLGSKFVLWPLCLENRVLWLQRVAGVPNTQRARGGGGMEISGCLSLKDFDQEQNCGY